MKIIHFLLTNIFAPLVVALLSATIIGTGSKVDTGNWVKWFEKIPKNLWIIIVAVILVWFIIIIIRKRNRQLQETDNGPSAYVIPTARWGWMTIEEIDYSGVVWRIDAPVPSPGSTFGPMTVSPKNIIVDTPPRCPKCKTELEESSSFWGGYIWKCVRCDFRKRNRNNYHFEAERVEKIARRDWEKRGEERSK
jgi:hypothetical protein